MLYVQWYSERQPHPINNYIFKKYYSKWQVNNTWMKRGNVLFFLCYIISSFVEYGVICQFSKNVHFYATKRHFLQSNKPPNAN